MKTFGITGRPKALWVGISPPPVLGTIATIFSKTRGKELFVKPLPTVVTSPLFTAHLMDRISPLAENYIAYASTSVYFLWHYHQGRQKDNSWAAHSHTSQYHWVSELEVAQASISQGRRMKPMF